MITQEARKLIPMQSLLEAVARATGARRAHLVASGARPPQPQGGWLHRGPVHQLTCDVPGSGMQLVLELPRPPTAEDRMVAASLARAFEPPKRPDDQMRPPGPWNSGEVLRAMTASADRRPEALVSSVLRAARSPAGGMATAGREPKSWTLGPGRPVLRAAALAAARGTTGTIQVAGRTFLALAVTWDGEVVGGFAAEDGRDSVALRTCLTAVGAVLAAAREQPAPPPDSAEDLRTLLALLPMPALAMDARGCFVGASPSAEAVFGVLNEFDLGIELAPRLASLRLSGVLAGGDPPAEIEVGDRRYEPRWAVLPTGIRVLVFLEPARTEEIEKHHEDLVAALAHELRTPIVALNTLLQVLRLPGGRLDADRAEALVGEGAREVGRLERLVEDLLLAFRAGIGGVIARPDDVDLRPIAEDVVRHLRHRYPDRRFEIAGHARAHADPGLVRHALWHLSDNAAKFGPTGASVHIELSDDVAPEVRVTDEGPGIFSGDLPNLFRRFRRLDRNATRQHGGAGVGLYLVKSVVEAQGGRVWVRSRLGKGSVFGFGLPAARS